MAPATPRTASSPWTTRAARSALLCCTARPETPVRTAALTPRSHLACIQVYFRGQQVLQALFDELMITFDMAHAEEVILSGTSAGGLAVYMHSNFFRKVALHFLSRPLSLRLLRRALLMCLTLQRLHPTLAPNP